MIFVLSAGMILFLLLVLLVWFLRIRPKHQHSKIRGMPNKLAGHLVIDGCNGPIKTRMRRQSDGRIGMTVTVAISHQGQAVDLISKLKERCESATIIFDGCSKQWPMDVSQGGFEWLAPVNRDLSEGSVRVLVTSREEEADHVIARMDEEYRLLKDQSLDSSRVQILKLVRSEQGPGRQKSLLRTLGLLQPNSVACLFPGSVFSSILSRQAQKVSRQVSSRQFDSLLRVDQHFPGPSHLLITATDDIFLRQRVQFCMTFRQLWDFLQGDEFNWPTKQARIKRNYGCSRRKLD